MSKQQKLNTANAQTGVGLGLSRAEASWLLELRRGVPGKALRSIVTKSLAQARVINESEEASLQNQARVQACKDLIVMLFESTVELEK